MRLVPSFLSSFSILRTRISEFYKFLIDLKKFRVSFESKKKKVEKCRLNYKQRKRVDPELESRLNSGLIEESEFVRITNVRIWSMYIPRLSLHPESSTTRQTTLESKQQYQRSIINGLCKLCKLCKIWCTSVYRYRYLSSNGQYTYTILSNNLSM